MKSSLKGKLIVRASIDHRIISSLFSFFFLGRKWKWFISSLNLKVFGKQTFFFFFTRFWWKNGKPQKTDWTCNK